MRSDYLGITSVPFKVYNKLLGKVFLTRAIQFNIIWHQIFLVLSLLFFFCFFLVNKESFFPHERLYTSRRGAQFLIIYLIN